ncbi:hypothetical protein ACS0TY_026792 [Phlomoides rotata]
MLVLTKIKKKQFGALIKRKNKKQERQSSFLKVVHPHGLIEIFRQPITAGEIMKRCPKHCVARTDFFEYPWIVVRPQSVLVPGQMFFLVSHKTVERTLKEKGQQTEWLNLEQSLNHDERHYGRQTKHHHSDGASSSNRRVRHDSDNGSSYRSSFYESWHEMQRRIQEIDQDLPLLSGRPHVESPEQDELQRVRSCLRRPDGDRRNLHLKVTFSSPVVVRSVRQHDLNFYVWAHDH